MKRHLSKFLFIGVFIITFSLTTVSIEANWHSICEISSTFEDTCIVEGTGSDPITHFTIRHADMLYKVNPYSVYHTSNSISGTVSRGSPYLRNLVLYDNKNGITYSYSGRFGRFLNDFTMSRITTNRRLDYYPAPYERPAAMQNLSSGSPLNCIPPVGIACRNYTTTGQFIIK